MTDLLASALRHLRHARRSLARTPAFTAAVVATLALAIGANAAVFSAINAVLLRPLDFPNADRLVRIRQVVDRAPNSSAVAAPRLEDWSRMSSALDSITGYYVEDVSDTTGELARRLRRAVVAPRFLSTLGIVPALGRDFTEAEQRAGGPAAVLVSDRYWRETLGADPSAIGAVVRIDDRPYTVVGVLPASFRFPTPNVEVWWPYPVNAPDAQNTPANRKLQWYTGIGRLEDGVTEEQALADLAAVQGRLAVDYPEPDSRIAPAIAPLKDTVVGGARDSFWSLFGGVTVLLLIACVNIASLLLSRQERRRSETAIRMSIGATRGAIVAQVLAETALLAAGGAALGVSIAAGLARVFAALAPTVPRLGEAAVDGSVLAYTFAITVAVTLACALLPALRSSGGTRFVESRRANVATGGALQWPLVGVQVALSVTLLAGAGYLVRTFADLSRVDPGFDASRVLAFRVSGNWSENYDDPAGLVQRVNRTLDELAALPGVEAAATSWELPGAPGAFQEEFAMGGAGLEQAAALAASRVVSTEYFGTLGIALLRGETCRRLTSGIHRPGEPLDVLVNQAFANRYLSGVPTLGRPLSWDGGNLSGRIVGVVADARELGVDRAPAPTVYACDSAPSPFPWYLVRATGEPLAVAATVRQRLDELEPLRSVFDVAPLERQIGSSYAELRLRTVLLTAFAATALLLACVGVYATLSFAIGQRRREIGLRIALGAGSRSIAGLFVLRALRTVAFGCMAGVAVAYALSRALATPAGGIVFDDRAIVAAVVGLVLAAATIAALLPALRASRIDPMRTLKDE